MATEDPTIAALSKLDQIIRDPQLRQQFLDDPDQTLRNAGAEPSDVPPTVWQALTEMSLAELAAIAALGAALAEDGLLRGDFVWRHVV
jgi:hypothetical protein